MTVPEGQEAEVQMSPVPTSMSEHVVCAVCGMPARTISEKFEGYIEGYLTEILECEGCQARFSGRMDIPDWLYDRIYAQAEAIPGYGRYARYESSVAVAREPLDLLAESEDPYWYVREYLRDCPRPEELRVLELGCGAGYLTFALRQAGVECVGVDISAEAIARARARYGHPDWFQTVAEFHQSNRAVDLVVALELIEHVPEPVTLLKDGLDLLDSNGALLLTTPDRDACRPGEVWASDAPPVHLYWLGRQALQAAAERCGATVEFPRNRPTSADACVPPANRLWPAILTADGIVTEAVRRSMRLDSRLRFHASALLQRLRNSVAPRHWREVKGLDVDSLHPGATLAAVLRRPSTHG
ncbi:class I SAM-dependent methyltransferase [Geodermatophilus sp. SYSU D01176]